MPSEHDGRWGREIRQSESKDRVARVHQADDARVERLIAVLHSIAISGIGGSIADFWKRLDGRPTEQRIRFCQALHQLCEAMGHGNMNRCELCERLGARDSNGYYTGDRFFDGTKTEGGTHASQPTVR
jgi:hypothetical protein